jgi:hypothetical protein
LFIYLRQNQKVKYMFEIIILSLLFRMSSVKQSTDLKINVDLMNLNLKNLVSLSGPYQPDKAQCSELTDNELTFD